MHLIMSIYYKMIFYLSLNINQEVFVNPNKVLP